MHRSQHTESQLSVACSIKSDCHKDSAQACQLAFSPNSDSRGISYDDE